VVVEADDISDEQKARICKKLGEADKVTYSNLVCQQLKIIEFDIILVKTEMSFAIMLVASYFPVKKWYISYTIRSYCLEYLILSEGKA
jgi:hypothetical protein